MGIACHTLGNAYYSVDGFQTATEYHERHLKLAKELGDKAGEGESYCNLGNAFGGLGDFKTAMEYHERHLKIAEELGDKAGEGISYCNLGNAFHGLGDFKTAMEYHERHLKIAKELRDKAGEGYSYCNLGNAFRGLGDFKTAMEYYERHLKIAKDLGDKAGEGISYCNLGNAFHDLGDFKTAVEYHERHLKIAEELGDNAGEGRSYCNLGNAFDGLGDFKTAMEYHERHLKIAKELGDKAGEGISYCNLGNAFHGLGDFKTAMEYHERHLKIAKELGDKAGEGMSYGNLGNAFHGLGDFKTAMEYHERHLKIAKELGDKAGEGNSYCNLGNAFHGLGDFKTAMEYHERQLKIAKELGDKAGEGNSYCNLGNAFHGLGDFKTAMEYHERDLKIAKELGDKAGEGISYCNLGNAFDGVGDFKTAMEYHERHLKIAKELGDKAGEGKSYCNLGNAFRGLGDFKTAMEYHERHLKIAKELGDKAGEGKSYCNLGNTFHGLGDFKTAMEYHERDLKIAKEVGDKAGEGMSYCNLGNAFHGLGDFKTAMEYHQRHLKIAEEVGNKNEVAGAFYSLACSLKREGCLARALVCYHMSVVLYNGIRASLQLKDQLKIFYRNNHKAAYTGLWDIHLKQGEVVKALLVADEGRAQALRDLLEVKYVSGAPYYHANSVKNPSFVSPSRISSSTVFIAVSGPYVVFWVIRDCEIVQSRRIHINNYISEEELETFIAMLNSNARKSIGVRAGIKCENLSLDVSHCDENVMTNALKTLYDIIVTPIADLIDGNELIFVPEGPFCLIPYAALENSKSKYLFESFRIRVLPSLGTLKLITGCSAEFHNKTGALLVGDPCFKEVLYEGKTLFQLPCAREEVEMIGRILDIAALVGEKATKDEVLKRLSSVALVHIATHGKKETGEIFLAPNTTRATRQPQEEDYLLTTTDVLQADLRARLVVLSCCHSALGEVMAEGVVGIARAFLGAGARSVLVSLWAIDDAGTLEFMNHFYKALVKGKSASEALNQSMKCMRESGQFRDVKYWAPFVLIGDDLKLELNEM